MRLVANPWGVVVALHDTPHAEEIMRLVSPNIRCSKASYHRVELYRFTGNRSHRFIKHQYQCFHTERCFRFELETQARTL